MIPALCLALVALEAARAWLTLSQLRDGRRARRFADAVARRFPLHDGV